MFSRKTMAVLNLVVVMVLSLLLASPGYAEGPAPQKFTATPLTPDTTVALTKVPSATGKMVPVIVKLKGDGLVSYKGGVPGYAPTAPSATGVSKIDLEAPASQAYLSYLNRQHWAFEAALLREIPTAQVTYQYKLVVNAQAVIVPGNQVASLAKMPGVEAVWPDELVQPTTDNSPQFIGAPTVWANLGGQQNAGDGTIIGVIDTGIWPEHPSFSDPDPYGKPFVAPPPAPGGARQCQFGAGANPGPAFSCNNKLIAAYRTMATYDSLVGPEAGNFTSPRDAEGHGTHTASTAAGNASVAASIYGVNRGTVSGIAPRAHVIMYKALGLLGGYSSDLAAAAQQAVLDGVNVINYSISGGANPFADTVEQAFLSAYNAGIFVSTSAGNAGPGANTTDHRGPWTTTVAASTQDRAFVNTVTLAATGASPLTLQGISITGGAGPAPLYVPPADVQCNNPFAAGSVAGKVVVCMRGVTGRAQKGHNVLQGGAVGMILYNQSPAVTDQETDNHWLPTTHIQFSQGQQVLAFLAANPAAQATLTAGAKAAAQSDVMASFSSRGGTGLSLGVAKPDITAPGVQVLAGLTPMTIDVASGPQGQLFQAIAGTSMSAPHIAGSAALLKALHPTWTPGMIRSAMMTTAKTSVAKEDGLTPADPFDDGSGRVDLTKAGSADLVFDETGANFVARQNDLWNANYPSVYVPSMPGMITVQRTAKSVLTVNSWWQMSVQYPSATDFKVTVPASINVARGGSTTFGIQIDGRAVPVGQWRTATIVLTRAGSHPLHIPVTFVRGTAPVILSKTCAPGSIPLYGTTTCTVSFQNNSFSNTNVNVVDEVPMLLWPLPGSATNGAVVNNRWVTWSGLMAGAQPPDVTIGAGVTPANGYVALSGYGITPVAGVGDETATNFNVPAFTYAGQTYTRIAMVSNGYAVVGGTNGAADVQFINQHLPDATRPNNVLAPWWTDLNPAFGGAMRVGVLTDGTNSWTVLDWEAVKEYGSGKAYSFQIWIRQGTVEDITFGYGTLQGNGDGGFLTVGAENLYGNRGASYYLDGTGTLPTSTSQLAVSSVPGAPGQSTSFTFRAKSFVVGPFTNYAKLTGDTFQGTVTAGFSGLVQ